MTGFHRVVFDTSTLVSAVLRVGSVPHQALRQAISKGEVFVSAATLLELERVLLRPKFDRYLALDARQAFVDLVRALALQVPVSVALKANVVPACRDPKDHPFLALARKHVCASNVGTQKVHRRERPCLSQPVRHVQRVAVGQSSGGPLEALRIQVERAIDAPVSFRGVAYERVLNTTRVMPRASYQRLLMEGLHATNRWETLPAAGYSADDQLSRAAVALFCKDDVSLPEFPQFSLRVARLLAAAHRDPSWRAPDQITLESVL